jgi:hypothetical protein
MASESQLQDAVIKVRIDDSEARTKLDALEKDGKKGERRGEDRKEKDDARKKDKQAKEKSGGQVAVIPGGKGLRRVIGTILQIEAAKLALSFGAGGVEQFGEAFKVIPGLRATADAAAAVMKDLVGRVNAVEAALSAGFGTVADAGAFARSQQLLTGEADLGDVAGIAAQQFALRSIETQLQKKRVLQGRVATGAVGVRLAAQTSKAALEAAFGSMQVVK